MKKTAAVALAVLLSACQVTDRNNKLAMSTVVGAVTGGVIGWFTLGGGTGGSTLGALALATAGGGAGYLLAERMLPREDRAAMDRTVYETLASAETGETRRWGDPRHGPFGTVTATRTFRNRNGALCRDFTATVTIEGKEKRFDSTACRLHDGAWRTI